MRAWSRVSGSVTPVHVPEGGTARSMMSGGGREAKAERQRANAGKGKRTG